MTDDEKKRAEEEHIRHVELVAASLAAGVVGSSPEQRSPAHAVQVWQSVCAELHRVMTVKQQEADGSPQEPLPTKPWWM